MFYINLYNNPSYSRILIGSRLWSIRGQTHRWRQCSMKLFLNFFEFWIWTNPNSLLSIATNQFASFCIDIRSRQCYFRVCQSGEIWTKKAFFPCILIFLLHKTNRFHVAVRLFSNNRSQMTSKCGNNKKVAHEAQPSVSLMFYSLNTLQQSFSDLHCTLEF